MKGFFKRIKLFFKSENYIQYAGGYQKENIKKNDIEKAISDLELMDDEHGAFWVGGISEDEYENVIEVNKDLSLSVILKEVETKYQASDWNEVKELFNLLLLEKFDQIKLKIK